MQEPRTVAGFRYIGSAFPLIDAHIVVLCSLGVGVLAVLNIVVGIRKSATVALVMACVSFLGNLAVTSIAAFHRRSPMQPGRWMSMR